MTAGIPVRTACPLGGKCETVKEEQGESVIERCALYTNLVGRNPQTGQDEDRWICAWTATPILLVEAIGNLRQVQAAVESQRNHNITGAGKVAAGLQGLAEEIRKTGALPAPTAIPVNEEE